MNRQDLHISSDFRIRPSIKMTEKTNNYRLFQRKNGELVLQNAVLETTEYLDDGSKTIRTVWKDIETVCEE